MSKEGTNNQGEKKTGGRGVDSKEHLVEGALLVCRYGDKEGQLTLPKGHGMTIGEEKLQIKRIVKREKISLILVHVEEMNRTKSVKVLWIWRNNGK